VVADMAGFEKQEFFELAEESGARENIDVSF
jgi:hypothetical protein